MTARLNFSISILVSLVFSVSLLFGFIGCRSGGSSGGNTSSPNPLQTEFIINTTNPQLTEYQDGQSVVNVNSMSQKFHVKFF